MATIDDAGHLSGAPASELGSAQRPAHYLAIPPALFGEVVEQLGNSGCANGRSCHRRKALRQRSGIGPGAEPHPARTFHEKDIFRIDHYLGKRPVHNMLFFRFANAFLDPFWNRNSCRERADHHGRGFRRPGPRRFYDQTGTIRDVVQNHLFQIMAIWRWSRPSRMDSESIRDEKVKVLKAIPPVDGRMWFADSFAAISRKRAWPRIPRRKPLPR